MGFRLSESVGMIPAKMEDGFIYVENDAVEKIKLPDAYKSVKFDMQCNPITNLSVRCYLKSDKYEFVLWENGACVNLTAGSRFIVNIVKKGSISLPNYNKDSIKLTYGGIMCDKKDAESGVGGQAYLCEAKNGYIYLIAENCPLVACGIDKNSYYYRYRNATTNQYLPYIYYDEGKLSCIANSNEFEVECERIINVDELITLKGVIS